MLGSSSTVKSNIANADSIQMIPVVSAEWNYNMFLQPYIAVGADGTKISAANGSATNTAGGTIFSQSSSSKPYKTGLTNKYVTINGSGYLTYNFNASGSTKAYKIVTYVRTNSDSPVVVVADAASSGAAEVPSRDSD